MSPWDIFWYVIRGGQWYLKPWWKLWKTFFHPKNFNFDEISCASFHQSYHPEHTLSPKLISTEQTSLPKWLSETDLVIKFCQHTLLPKFRKSGQVKAGQNRLGQDRTIFSCMGLYVSFCSNMYLYGPACSCMVPYGPVLSLMVLFGHISSCVVPYGTVWYCIVLNSPIWSLVIPIGPVWSRIVPYSPVWSCSVLFGLLWSHMKYQTNTWDSIW